MRYIDATLLSILSMNLALYFYKILLKIYVLIFPARSRTLSVVINNVSTAIIPLFNNSFGGFNKIPLLSKLFNLLLIVRVRQNHDLKFRLLISITLC